MDLLLSTCFCTAATKTVEKQSSTVAFSATGLPGALRGNVQRIPDSFSDSSSDDDSACASFYQSSVEVHQPRRPQGGGNIQSYGATASLAFTDENSTDDNAVGGTRPTRGGYMNLDGADAESAKPAPQEECKFLIENLEGLEGAVGGISIDDRGLDLVEDHYCMENAADPGPGVHGRIEQDPLMTRSDSSSTDEPEVAVRNASLSRTSKKSKRRPQNGMV